MDNFSKEVMQLMQAKLGDEVTIKIENIIKTNDMNLTAVMIHQKDKDTGLNLYLDSYYESYKQGCPIGKIVESLVEQYQSSKNDIPTSETIVHLKDFELMKEHITIRLLNKKMNEEYLKGKCYMEYLDFAIVFAITIDEKQRASTLVLEELRSIWNVSKEELYEVALANMQSKEPCKIVPIQNMLFDLAEEHGEDMRALLDDLEISNPPFYVMTNESGIFGAVTILYKDVLKQFAEEHSVDSVMMIPASVHEWILLWGDETLSKDYLQDMVTEVNNMEIRPDELLSYNIYQYDYIKDEVCICAEE